MDDDIAFFPLNGIVLALYPRWGLAGDAGVPQNRPAFRLSHSPIPGRRPKWTRFLARHRRSGARIVKPAQKTIRGGYGGYFADPDGFLWEVAYNPAWNLDRNGNVKL